jgi:hypothetical protein
MAVGSGGMPRLWDREAGSAGIGKSALLQDTQRLAEQIGVIVLRARAGPVEPEYRYGVVRQLFEHVLARDGPRAVTLLSGAAAGARDVLGDTPGAAVTEDTSFASLHVFMIWVHNPP